MIHQQVLTNRLAPRYDGRMLFTSTDTQTIRERRKQFNDAILAHDVRALEKFWTPDIQVSTSANRALIGKDAYRAAFERFFGEDDFITFAREPKTITISDDGKTAAEQGEWLGRWRANVGEKRQRGVYLASWRKATGQWLIQSELYVPLGADG
jgi:ketosteroid isomerase-like protein